MTTLSEKVELLGKGVYNGAIPDTITLKSIPTAAELDIVGAEDFEQTMLDTIFPKAIEEDFDYRQLLEIDYDWICRCLRILNYGPYHTTNSIFCSDCNSVSNGEYSVDLRTVECNPLPLGFNNDVVISKDEFIDFPDDIHIKLLTIQDKLNARKDSAFKRADGSTQIELARICYMIKSIGPRDKFNPVEIKWFLTNNMSDADFRILKEKISESMNYGLIAGGLTVCPKCHSKSARFLALVNDKFFRTTLGDLKRWRDDKRAGQTKDAAGSKTDTVRKHS